MILRLNSLFNYVFGPEAPSERGHLRPRWLWLRALGLIFFSAFYSLLFQIRGLIGPDGILPAGRYLSALHEQAGAKATWYVPSLLWLSNGNHALLTISWAGLIASILLVLNFWPRGMIAICLVMFLSFVSAAQEFSSYQSDGMLLEAAFISLFFAPPGWRPGLGGDHPASRASLFLLRWEWFRIYFESGIVKMASHDPQWRGLTALDHYYENGPLPDWIGWYAQQLPHRFQASIALTTLVIELGLVWMLFLPRRFRHLCFLIVTPLQIGIILTANLGFLNCIVLCLGVLLLDDEFLVFWSAAACCRFPFAGAWVRRRPRASSSRKSGSKLLHSRAIHRRGNPCGCPRGITRTSPRDSPWAATRAAPTRLGAASFDFFFRFGSVVGLLQHHASLVVDDFPGLAPSYLTHRVARAVSDIQSIWALCGHDQRAV